MKIYTYYQKLQEDDQREQDMLALWKEQWTIRGWEPEVLSLAQAMNHPSWKELFHTVRSYPTVNDSRFETACYLRWLALFSVDGGFLADYDVLPVREFNPFIPDGLYSGTLSHGPGLIFARVADLEKIIAAFLDHDADPKHNSDMTILHARRDLFKTVSNHIRSYGEPGWREGPLVHFFNGGMWRYKAQLIRSALGDV